MKPLSAFLRGHLDRRLEEEIKDLDFEAIASFMAERKWHYSDGATKPDELRELVRDLWRTVRNGRGTVSCSSGGFTVELIVDEGSVHGVEIIFDATHAFRRDRQ